jgi:hypothetical protein
MTMPEFLTYLLATVGTIVFILIGLLTYQVYKTDMYRPDLRRKNNK